MLILIGYILTELLKSRITNEVLEGNRTCFPSGRVLMLINHKFINLLMLSLLYHSTLMKARLPSFAIIIVIVSYFKHTMTLALIFKLCCQLRYTGIFEVNSMDWVYACLVRRSLLHLCPGPFLVKCLHILSKEPLC